MTTCIKCITAFVFFIFTKVGFAQNILSSTKQVLTFEEYLGYVKKHHPLMKQAELRLSIGEAGLLKSRGGFDPKVEVDYNRKKFKSTEYYDQLNATFKIPTWYGIEFKANFEENTGDFLDPSLTLPKGGLYSAGVSFSLAQGFLMNKRMASLKKARFFTQQTKADRDLLVNNLLFEASKAYFEWLKISNEQVIYETFITNAATRLKAIKRSIEAGDKAAIDSIEAKITLQNRRLNLETASLKRRKAALLVSNFLWLNDIPIEVQDHVYPMVPKQNILETALLLQNITTTNDIPENHPKLLSLDAKINGLTVDRALKLNKLLPKIDVQYNFLTPESDKLNTLNTTNYKASVNFSFPLFLRKERGDLRLAKLKIQEANFERMSTSLTLKNKIDAVDAEINSLVVQNKLITDIIADYKTLITSEERKFFLGESSLFLINSREQKLIDAQLKENTLRIKRLTAKASLYNTLGLTY
jgi:outer membrane protein TolC